MVFEKKSMSACVVLSDLSAGPWGIARFGRATVTSRIYIPRLPQTGQVIFESLPDFLRGRHVPIPLESGNTSDKEKGRQKVQSSNISCLMATLEICFQDTIKVKEQMTLANNSC